MVVAQLRGKAYPQRPAVKAAQINRMNPLLKIQMHNAEKNIKRFGERRDASTHNCFFLLLAVQFCNSHAYRSGLGSIGHWFSRNWWGHQK